MHTKSMMPQVSLAALEAGRPRGALGAPRAEAAGRVEALLADVKAELERIGGDVKRTAEEALAEAKRTGGQTQETKARADELINKFTGLSEAQANLEGKLEALETRSTDIEQVLADRRGRGRQAPKSMGAQVAESEDVKALAAKGGKGTIRVEVQNAITSIDGSAGDLIWSDRETEIVGLPQRQMTIRRLLMPGRTASNLVEYAKMITRTNSAAPVTEGAQKPESNYVWDRADAPVRTIAHFVHVSRQALEDAAVLQSEIDGELRYGLDLVEETQLLKGSGIGENLSGLVTEATAYSAEFAPTSETMIDVLRLAMLQVVLAEYPATGIVLHPTDWARIELQKDGEQRYLWASPRGSNGPGLWGLPVVETQSMDADEFLVGAFRMAATIYDRMDAEVVISSEDRDNFIKNMLTVRAEKRLALAVKRPAALVTGDFGNVT